jgi:integrase
MFYYSKELVTVACILDKRTIKADGTYPIKIRVNMKRVRSHYLTGKSITLEEWEKLPANKSATARQLKESIENTFSIVKFNVESLLEKGNFSFEALDYRMGKSYGDTLNNVLKAKIDQLKGNNQLGSMQIYINTLGLVEEFAGTEISFDKITVHWLEKIEKHWLKTKNQTSVGIHFRNIRTMVNEARRAGMIKDSQYPFGKGGFEIKTGESIKKALNKEQVAKIVNYKSENKTDMMYRDLWLFIYLCNGINVADMIKLKFSNIDEDEIWFIRQKTERTSRVKRQIRATLSPELTQIINKWGNPYKKDGYIFPYLDGTETTLERQKKTKDLTKRINKRMKTIGDEIGINNISTYTARHTFATMLKRGGVNISYISESLGHADVKTTEAYLASYEKQDRTRISKLLMTDIAAS